MARLAEIQRDAQRVADPRGASADEVEAAAKRLPAIVWLAHSVHGGEASGVEAGLALLYQLAAGTDAETRMALDSAVVLIDQNPDGRRHVHDVERTRSSQSVPNEPGALNNTGSWPGPRTSHYSFDLNRDWFIQSHPETRGRVASFLKWMPHVAVDLHEQGSSSTFYFAPPREPDNKNNPRHLFKWFDIFAAPGGVRVHGWSYFRREGTTLLSWLRRGLAVRPGDRMLFGRAPRRARVRRNDGTLRSSRRRGALPPSGLRCAPAKRRTELVSDYARAPGRDPDPRGWADPAVVFERDGQAGGLAGSWANGTEVQQLAGRRRCGRDPFGSRAAPSVTAGQDPTWWTRAAAGRAEVDPRARCGTGLGVHQGGAGDAAAAQPDRFYDITAWSLPYAWRVKAWHTRTVPGGLKLASDPVRAGTTVGRAQYGYAFAPGSEASNRLLASLLRTR
jgi:hypothetical protein